MRVTRSSGNIFRDLGFPNPEQEQLNAQLTLRIYRIIKARGLTQSQATQILGIRQPHVSVPMHSGAFSVERLMGFLTLLGQHVSITVTPTHRRTVGVSLVGP